ncbi:MAG: formylglycine-generating enzyme family protein [Polyangiales bacterium]
MTRRVLAAVAALVAWGSAASAQADVPADMRAVRGGTYAPFYRLAARPTVTVRPFLLDVVPVTEARFAAFVRANPAWRRGAVRALFADAGYLAHWAGADAPGPAVDPARPVTRVSWFAARAFCRSVGRRLPTEAEWEFVARASERSFDAPRDPATVARILAWYARPGDLPPGPVGAWRPNAWGVHDLHGLVWEWVEDFNSAMVVTDSRDSTGPGAARFCGAASLGARDTGDYAAFMRYAFRQSLRGAYAVHNLGFRCARDVADGGAP